MQILRCKFKPESPFATDFRGDVLFGHACWAIRWIFGEQRLKSLLTDYTNGKPFLIIGDPLPVGCLPRPALPIRAMGTAESGSLKKVKKLPFLGIEAIERKSTEWLGNLCDAASDEFPLRSPTVRMHNSISRETGTTGEGAMFAPRAQHAVCYRADATLESYILIDETLMSIDEICQALSYIGSRGYGKRSSVGYGQFSVSVVEPCMLPRHAEPNALLTLGRCVPAMEEVNSHLSLYTTVTHFGRHGDQLASGKVFKKPILFMEAGALLAPPSGNGFEKPWVGTGVGGVSSAISEQQSETVHQGYAPAVAVQVAWESIYGNS